MKFSGLYADAIRLYKEVLKRQPLHCKAKYNIGSCLLYSKNSEDAAKEFKSIIKSLNSRKDRLSRVEKEVLHGCYIQLNVLSYEMKQYEAGRDYLMQSLDVLPDNPLSYLNLAILAVKTDEKSSALKWLKLAVEHKDSATVLGYLSDEDAATLESLKNSTSKGG